MAQRIAIPYRFTPRFYQYDAMADLNSGILRAIDVWHRRAGKDLSAMHHTNACAHERVAAYWHFFPTLEQGRKAIWEGFTKEGVRIVDAVFPRPLVARRNNQQMVIELKNGSIWRLMGTDKMESVGAGPAGVVFSEFSLCRPTSWDFVRPMLRENGGWAWFIFTPRGRNHAHKLLEANRGQPGWRTAIHTVHDTRLTYASVRHPGRILTPDEMMDEERAEGMPEAMIRQEYLCDFDAANIGSVWGDLIEALEKRGGISEFDHPKDGVYTVWDLGISDATGVWFFRANEHGVPDVIDYFEGTGKPLSYYMDEIDGRGYKYVKHWLPHDARARTLQTGISTIELCAKRWGMDRVGISPELSLPDGIQAARWMLQQQMRIHRRCEKGTEALRSYHYVWDEVRKVFSSKPEHDWSSHPSDAFRGMACVVRASEFLAKRSDNSPSPPPAGVRLNDVWETVPKRSGGRI